MCPRRKRNHNLLARALCLRKARLAVGVAVVKFREENQVKHKNSVKFHEKDAGTNVTQDEQDRCEDRVDLKCPVHTQEASPPQAPRKGPGCQCAMQRAAQEDGPRVFGAGTRLGSWNGEWPLESKSFICIYIYISLHIMYLYIHT